MLRCNFIDGINGLIHILGNEDIAVVIKRLPDNLLTGQLLRKGFHLFGYLVGKLSACGN